MDFLKTVLQVVSGFTGLCLTAMMLYQLVLTLFGFKKNTKDYADHAPASRFLILVPAHNEERVIGDIVSNLQRMDYPKELYDFYVIADNCTDGTAEAARKLGAKVIETCKESPDAPTGKSVALRKALDSLGDYEKHYDLMMVFDADNLMDVNMLREVNSQYLDKGKPELIQCYLGAKNKKGVVAWSYYSGYTLTNRFFDLSKHRLGLNCVIGGTGFAMSTAYLRERGGWFTKSLTEDLELQVEATLDGKRVLWNHNTRVYDEKPTSLRASIRQKIRWGQGHWYVAFHHTGDVFRALHSGKIGLGEFVSVLTYIYSIAIYVLAVVQAASALALSLLSTGTIEMNVSLSGILLGLALFCYSFLFLFYLADWIDNRIAFDVRTIPVMIGGVLVTSLVCFFNEFVGLARWRDQQHWVKTEHALGGAQTVSQHAPTLRREAA